MSTILAPEVLKNELVKLFPDTIFMVVQKGQDTGWVPDGHFGVIIKPRRINGNGQPPINIVGINYSEVLEKARRLLAG